jgi:hypothetical protein
MADAVPKPVRKLPFKPTALGRSRAAPRPSSSAESDGKGKGKQKATDSDEDDDLALFRRSREMAPRIAADRERRLAKAKRQKEGEEQRRAFYGEKRPLEEDGGSEHGTSQDRLASPTLGGVVDGIEGEGANEEAVGSTDAIRLVHCQRPPQHERRANCPVNWSHLHHPSGPDAALRRKTPVSSRREGQLARASRRQYSGSDQIHLHQQRPRAAVPSFYWTRTMTNPHCQHHLSQSLPTRRRRRSNSRLSTNLHPPVHWMASLHNTFAGLKNSGSATARQTTGQRLSWS